MMANKKTEVLWVETIKGVGARAARKNLYHIKGSDTSRGSSPVAIVGGYWVRGDDGGGVFCWDPSSHTGDNGGTIIVPIGSTTGRWKRIYDELYVDHFGTKADGSDDSGAINRAITAVGNGGKLGFRDKAYTAQSPILAENLRGITLIGASGQYGFNGSRIIGSHTGKAILSLVGTLFASVENIILEGDTANRPKTGLLLGRSTAASAGDHVFINLKVQGFYSIAGVYNVASEGNDWYGCVIQPNAAPFAGMYMSQADWPIGVIGGLVGSSMEQNNFYGGEIGNGDTTPGSAGLFLDCVGSTGHHHFYSTFFTEGGGDSFIFIRLGLVDGLDTTFPIGFHDCFGEGNATNGLHLSASNNTSWRLAGFTARNLRFQSPLTNNILCDDGVYLVAPEISTPWMAPANKPSTFSRVDGGSLSLLAESAITINQLRGSSLTTNVKPTITTSIGNVIRDLEGSVYSIPQPLTSWP